MLNDRALLGHNPLNLDIANLWQGYKIFQLTKDNDELVIVKR